MNESFPAVRIMNEQDALQRLAALLSQRNAIEGQIAAIIGRPAHPGHIGEFVASKIFDIELPDSAVQKGNAGHFKAGILKGKSVNVKKYSLGQGILDIRPDALPDYYLVLTGPKASPASSRGTVQPWTIASVYLFDAKDLMQQLNEHGVRIGIATSVRQKLWLEAEIYPSHNNPLLSLTTAQMEWLELFRSS